MTGHLALGRDDRLMVIVPHPDDESLAAGGLLQRARAAGAAARVVFATAGENNPWTQRLLERRVRIGRADRERFGARRRGEALAALSRLGIDAGEAAFLGFPDQGITALLTSGDEEALHRLAAQIDLFRPTLLVAPAAPDLHPDHSALAVLTRLALSRAAPRRSAPERARLLGYLVHTRDAPPEGPALLELSPTAEERERKRAAILCYATQLSVHRRKFLAFADRPERFYPDDAGLDLESGRDPAGALHPVRLASIEAGALRLEIVLRARPGAFGRPALLFRADRALGGGRTLSLDLDWRAGRAAIRRDGAAGAGEARLRGGRRGGVVEIPLAALAPADRLFVKVERPFGFFDEAGWIEVPAPGAAGASRAPEISGSGVVCVVPCYNVGSLCGPVVRGAAALADRVIAVDDGSTDDTGQVLRAAAAGDGRIRLISFAANRGKGTALLEAFRSALSDPLFDVLVTIDGDGQHRPADIPRLVAACREGADLVIGERALVHAAPQSDRQHADELLPLQALPARSHRHPIGFPRDRPSLPGGDRAARGGAALRDGDSGPPARALPGAEGRHRADPHDLSGPQPRLALPAARRLPEDRRGHPQRFAPRDRHRPDRRARPLAEARRPRSPASRRRGSVSRPA